MPASDTQLESLLRQVAQSDEPRAHHPLDAEQLVARVRSRRQHRLARRGAVVAGCLLLVTGWATHYWQQPKAGEMPTVATHDATPADSWDALRSDLAKLEQQTLSLPRSESVEPSYTFVDAYLEARQAEAPATDQPPCEPGLDQLRRQVAELEHKLAIDTSEVEYDSQRSQSAALQLQLAELDAASHPDRAQQAYRQIASTYPDTQWGQQAQLLLTHVP